MINNKEFLAKESMYSSSIIHTKLYPDGKAMVRISDCKNSIRLWNEFNTKEGQEEMFEKIDTLITHLAQFKERLNIVLDSRNENTIAVISFDKN